MTKSKTTFTRAFSGFLIILALMAIFSLIGGSSASSQTGDNGEKLVTIEAGTYVFDDLVPHYRWPEENIPLFFTCSWVDYSGTLVYTEAKSINFYRDVIMGEHVWNIMDYGFTTYMYGDESQLDKGWVSVHKCVSRPGLNVCEEEWGDEGYKIITLPYDQKVTEAAGKWIDIYLTRVENTEGDVGNTDDEGSFGETPTYKENVIYAGTYRFNDTLTTPTSNIVAVPFTTDSITIEGAGTFGEWVRIKLVLEDDENVVVYQANDEYDTELGVYASIFDNHWSLANDIDSAFPIGYGQTITVTKDTEVDDTFFTWFTENTQMLIEAGTYRWNDELSFDNIAENTYVPISYTTSKTLGFSETEIWLTDEPMSFVGLGLELSGNHNNLFNIKFLINSSNYDEGLSPYNSIHYWEAIKYLADLVGITTGAELTIGFGQTITITKDTYVPVDFGAWFECNAAKWEAAETDTSAATASMLNIPFNEVLYIPTSKDDLMCA